MDSRDRRSVRHHLKTLIDIKARYKNPVRGWGETRRPHDYIPDSDEFYASTRLVLDAYGFKRDAATDELFLAYGKDEVRDGIDLFGHFEVNRFRDIASMIEDETIRSKIERFGLVATIDLISRIGIPAAQDSMADGKNVFRLFRSHYGENPLKQIDPSKESEIKAAATYNVVQRFAFGIGNAPVQLSDLYHEKQPNLVFAGLGILKTA